MVCRHRLELMRHIYNGGGENGGDSFDKDEAWNNCLELEMDQSGLGPRPSRWVTQTLPDTMCVVCPCMSLVTCHLFQCLMWPVPTRTRDHVLWLMLLHCTNNATVFQTCFILREFLRNVQKISYEFIDNCNLQIGFYSLVFMDYRCSSLPLELSVFLNTVPETIRLNDSIKKNKVNFEVSLDRWIPGIRDALNLKNRIFNDLVQNSFDTYPPYQIMT